MKRAKVNSLVTLLALSVIAAVLASCAPVAATTSSPPQPAVTQPSVSPSPTPSNPTGADRLRPGTSGTITLIEGNTITVSNQQGQTKVNVLPNTLIQKTVPAVEADLIVGQAVSVAGSADANGEIVASRISLRLQNAGAPAFTPAPGANPNPGQRPGRTGDNATGGFARGGVVGTIATVSGDTLTLTTVQSQQSTVKINAQTSLDKVVSGSLSDMKAGDFVVAVGVPDPSGNIDAASISIGSAGSGGFGP
jgi:hypothetical protein